MLKKIYIAKNSNNLICTNLIGSKYKKYWEKHCKKNWLKYCKKHKINLAYFDERIHHEEIINKNYAPTWQRLLIGIEIKKFYKKISNVCYLDTDILINHHLAPNIFKDFNKKKISLVSCVKNLPYSRNFMELQKLLSFFRNKFVSKKYPLNSSSLLEPKQLYSLNKLEPMSDYANAGVMVFNIKERANILFDCFKLFEGKNLLERDQTAINYFFQKKKLVNWIDYKFNTLWVYEMCFKYPFLYFDKKKNIQLIKDTIFSSFLGSYFIHFAGNWSESDFLKYGSDLDKKKLKNLELINDYLNRKMILKINKKKITQS